MKIQAYLQVVFVLCCWSVVEIYSQTPGACTVSINRAGSSSLELCPCDCAGTCFIPNQECIPLVPDGSDCYHVSRGENQTGARYCFSNCPNLSDENGCISTEISPCPLPEGSTRNMTVNVSCLTSTTTTTPTVPLSVVAPTSTHTPTTLSSGSRSSSIRDKHSESSQSLSSTMGYTTAAAATSLHSPNVAITSLTVKQEQSSSLATLQTSANPTTISLTTRENIITPTSSLQPRLAISTVQQQGEASTFSFNTPVTTTNTMLTTAVDSETVKPTPTVSESGDTSTSQLTSSHQSTPATTQVILTTSAVMTSLTTTTPMESPTTVQPNQNTPSTKIPIASISTTSSPAVTIMGSVMSTATPVLPPTMSTQETSQASTATVQGAPILLTTTEPVVTTSSRATTLPPKQPKDSQSLSPLALTLISVLGGLSVIIALATCVTLAVIICTRKKQKSYIMRNGTSHTEPVYSEVFEAEGGQPHLYESMTRYMVPSYSLYKKKRFPPKAGGNLPNNTVLITISDTHEERDGTLPTSNGTAEAHLSGLSEASNLQVDSYVPNPYETPVSSLGDLRDLRDHEGYAQVRNSNGTASPVIVCQISDHGYSDIRPITNASRSYSLGDVRNGYVNVRDGCGSRIYESIRSPTKMTFRSRGYVNTRKYYIRPRSYSLDDIRNRPYVNVPPPSPIGELKLGGYTDVSSRKPRPRSYESPVSSPRSRSNESPTSSPRLQSHHHSATGLREDTDNKEGGFSVMSSPRPRSHESPTLSVANSEGRGSTSDHEGGSYCGDEPDETHTDGGGYSKLDTSLLDGYAILEPYIKGRNNIYSHLRYNL